MGSGSSKQGEATIQVFREDPYPPQQGLAGVSVGGAQGCSRCVLKVNAGVSTSSVKLRREYGSVSASECKQYGQDADAVRGKRMAFAEFKRNLMNGKYLIPI